MRKYHIILAYDVPCYHTVVVEARNAGNAERIARAKLVHLDSALFTPEWDMSSEFRIVDVVDATEVRA